ncbi:MAG: class I SAM-dependent methyltransferase [Acidobacteria bacterium]|nr:class I SAM-dependent methyltransferase [Acidobacteriota bacterium]
MSQSEPTGAPTPDRIFQTMLAYQASAALKGAIELGLFTAIADGATTAAALATQCQASERGIRILCDYLGATGFLTKDGDNYGLAPDTAIFLNQHSPAYLGSLTRFLNSSYVMGGFQDIAETVRRGTTLLGGTGSMEPEHPMWVEFARAMVPMMFPAAEEIAQIVDADQGKPCRVLDIAAGHGIFGVLIAKHNPNAEITAVDWKAVLAVAEENAQHFGVADRFHTVPGSAFDVDYGTGYDFVLFTNFFHHFDEPTCEMLMKKALASLNEGGRAVTLEFAPNEDRISPPPLATFGLTMLATTGSGEAYTVGDYDRMFRNAGYARTEMHQLTKSPQRVIVSYK